MTSADFIAWSLAASGIIAIAIVGAPRIYSRAVGKPPYHLDPIQSIMLFGTVLILGPMSMRIVCHMMLKIEPPRWSSLLMGPMFLLLGVQNLVAPRRTSSDHTYARTTAYIMCAIGLLVSVLEFSDFLFTART